MRTLSPKQVFDIKKRGGELELGSASVKKAPANKIPSVEESMVTLTDHIRKIADTQDVSKITLSTLEDITIVLSQTSKKISEIQSAKSWDIDVERGKDNLITRLNLKSIK